ncbi:flagellar biosynthesis protein FlaG [Bacillus sp. M6-12]|uniref:flagellar protein FlaG n=1 Tax=Bacillus sp. M6-12 TaxID=2054166 RepID=UPI000C795479|nr:flagellar protein FlaG [Bacillus sp. M6-12]PLS17895.1 flagellar biosynthesis protein FlaG [Bacillus sp. M6-12]
MKIDDISSSVYSGSLLVKKNEESVKAEPSSLVEQQQENQLRKNNDEKEEKKELSKEEAEHVVKGMNEFLTPKMTSLNFELHEKLDRYYVEVVDVETKKVIREIPSKELLDVYAKMTEYLGLFIDKKL